MSEDRRKELRVPALIEVSWNEASGGHEARTSDISQNGCFVLGIARVTPGEVINFRLHLPADDPIEIRGEVVYNLPNSGFGVRFISGISDHDWQRIERAINA